MPAPDAPTDVVAPDRIDRRLIDERAAATAAAATSACSTAPKAGSMV